MSVFPPYRPFHPMRLKTALMRLVALIGFFMLAVPAFSQPINPEVRIAVRADNQAVFIYHTELSPIGHGFNIYRRIEGEAVFRQLNVDPVRGVASGPELRALLGTLYDDVEVATQQDEDSGVLTRLRSDTKMANLLTFIYPQIAEALGRLFIDTQAPSESPATYRIEFVDALDEPTGQVLEKTVLLLPQKPDAPTQLRAQNQGNKITLFWRFIPPNERVDDKVIRFEAYRIDPTTNQHQLLHDKVILRNNALFEYALTFETPTTGQTEQLYVRAIDISGQASEPSPMLRYDALDLDPPRGVVDVSATRLPNQRVQIRWQISDADDVAGYNLYRASSLMDESAYVRLNSSLLSLNETTFNDTLLYQDASNVYYYRITAVDAAGNEGPLSTAAMALIEDLNPPATPTDLVASARDDGTVALAWRAEQPADFSSFIVLRKPIGPREASMPIRLNPAALTENEYIDGGIAGQGFREGVVYQYQVLSADLAGNFSRAAIAEIKIQDRTAPPPPNGAQAIVDTDSRIALFWNPSPAIDLMSYLVYRRERGSSRLQAFPVSIDQRRYDDESVVPGTQYEYWVTAADSAGNESPSSERVSILMRDSRSPRQVRNVRVTSDTSGVSMSWEPVSAFDLAGYRVYRSDTQTGRYELLHSDLLIDTRWRDDEGREGNWYRVHALDTSGNESPPSRPARAQPMYGN